MPRTCPGAFVSRCGIVNVNPKRILVVGDAMLDRYWSGAVDRLSRESRAPVLRVTRRVDRAGGAANVAANLAALGAAATLLAPVGRDAAADALAALLREAGVAFERVDDDPAYATTEKIRCVSRDGHLLRADVEMPLPEAMRPAIAARFGALLASHDIVVMSDHANGALADCATLMDAARAAGRPVLVDPRGGDWARYAGALFVKPDRAELDAVLGERVDDAHLATRVAALRRGLGWRHLLVTQGEGGMTLHDDDGVSHWPAQVRDAREVRDVNGAGDTVMAALAWRIGEGDDVAAALRWANCAAGLAVREFGTATVARADLERAMARADGDAAIVRAAAESSEVGTA